MKFKVGKKNHVDEFRLGAQLMLVKILFPTHLALIIGLLTHIMPYMKNLKMHRHKDIKIVIITCACCVEH